MQISQIYNVLSDNNQTSLAHVKTHFSKWLFLEDNTILDILLGAYLANLSQGEPVWLLIVGPSGGLKTELIRSLELAVNAYPISTLSPQSLISGAKKEGKEDPSLLSKLDGKILLIKDFTTVLTLPSGKRREILGMLRDAYDGYSAKYFGNIGLVSYRARFGLIAGVTPVIDKYADVETELGERYLKVRLRCSNPTQAIRKALDNNSKETIMRSELQVIVGKFTAYYSADKDLKNISIEPQVEKQLIAMAHVAATIRTRVSRHWKTETLEYLPQAEQGTRLVKQLAQLGKGIAITRGKDTVSSEEFELIRRVGEDSVPSLRHQVLDVLSSFEDYTATEVIAQHAGLTTKTTLSVLEDLFVLKVVERDTLRNARGQPHYWLLSSEFREMMSGYRP